LKRRAHGRIVVPGGNDMRVQPAERNSTNFGAGSSHAPATFDRAAARSGGLDRTKSDPAASPALPDQQAAYALLTEQCRSRIDALAPRQRDVLAGLVVGCSNKEIAHPLGISPRTIEIYRAGMMVRLKARTLAQALHIAFVAGLVPFDSMSLTVG
jgi:DNA-binding NarL/FixJ family response regulator